MIRIIVHIYVPSVLMGFGLGMLLIAATPWFGLVLVGMTLVGAAAGLATGSMTSFTYDIVAPDARGSVQAFRRSVGEVGAFSGPIVGGLVAGISHAGIAFAVFAPLHLASALLVGLVAHETLNRMPRPEPRPVAAGRAPSA
jgi:predicted MFS family arabinose efflux permease